MANTAFSRAFECTSRSEKSVKRRLLGVTRKCQKPSKIKGSVSGPNTQYPTKGIGVHRGRVALPPSVSHPSKKNARRGCRRFTPEAWHEIRKIPPGCDENGRQNKRSAVSGD